VAEEPKVLVTGGTGLVGSHVVDALLEAGLSVRCTVRATSNLRWLDGKAVELVEADLTSGALGPAVAGVDGVVHCAGLTRGSRRELMAANHEGTRMLLAACGETGQRVRFVFCSSQAAAGPGKPNRPRVVTDAPAPVSDYGRSKLAAEEEVLAYSGQLEITILRPGAVYGPRDEDTLPYFKMASRGLLVAPGLRERLVQLVHVRDVAQAMLKALRRADSVGRTYFVAHPEVVSWRRMAAALTQALGGRTVTLRLPSALVGAAGAISELLGGGRRAGQLDRRRARDMAERAWTCDVGRAIDELDWSPTFDIEEGFRDSAEWYRKEGWL
jgi:nucleoside-diphosphate-sugar epimerase